jgi:alkylation response protein AidB-like acyl-CoA dehydrogenase
VNGDTARTAGDARERLRSLDSGASPSEVALWVEEELGAVVRSELNPSACEADRELRCIPAELFRRLGEKGLLGYLLPEALGGLGGSRRNFGLILEQLGYISLQPELPSLLSLFADLPCVVASTRREELIERYVQPMARGECLAAFAYTELGDVADFRTQAHRTERGYVIRGEKAVVTGGAIADVFLTYVKGEKGLEVFLIERGDPGVTLTPVPTMGFRAGGLSRLTLQDVELPAERRVVASDGLGHVQAFLNARRLYVVCGFPGRMRAILETVTRHLQTVVREGLPVTEMQVVQARLGRMFARTQTAEAVLHSALDHWVSPAHNDVFDAIVAAAKYTLTELAAETARDAIYLTGWMGYSEQLPFERDLRSFMGAVAGQTAQDKLEIFLGTNFCATHRFLGA